MLLGAYVESRGEHTDAERRAAVLDHEVMIGRQLALVNEFFSFSKDWNLERLRWHLDSGRGLMISWNGTNATDVLSGSLDDVIRQRARWTADLAAPIPVAVLLGTRRHQGRSWGYHDDPTLYHDVWKHVRSIFAEEGVDNAKWVWAPTTWHFTTGNAPAFFPGDDVVDVIGADGYMWSPCVGDVESAHDVFGDFLLWAKSRPQPIVLSEWGADSDTDGEAKVGFITEMHDLVSRIDNLLAVVVFDSTDPGDRGVRLANRHFT